MILQSKAFTMALLFCRTCTYSFQLTWRHLNRGGMLRHHKLNPPPRSCCCYLSYKHELSESDTPESDLDAVNVPHDLQSCIYKFVNEGSLSQEESTSISNALFRSPFGRSLVSSPTLKDMKDILQSSIDSYLTQKKRRVEIGREAIGNPGSYIRSIVKKEVDLGETDKAISIDKEKTEILAYAVKSSNETPAAVGNEDAIGVPRLRKLLRFYSIESDELNEVCLHALSKHEALIVNYSLKTYVEQKRRREESGMNMIANPSSYVMAIVRNSLETPPSSADLDNLPTLDNKEQDDQPHGIEKWSTRKDSDRSPITSSSASPSELSAKGNIETLEKDVFHTLPTSPASSEEINDINAVHHHVQPDAQSRSLPLSKYASSETSSKVNAFSSKEVDRHHGDNIALTLKDKDAYQPVDSRAPNNNSRVTMEYVDKCLSMLNKLEQSVNTLPGVGVKTEIALNKLGLFTIRDLMWYFPRSFIDRSILQRSVCNIPDGELGTFIMTVHKEEARHNAVPCTDEEGNRIDIVFVYGQSRQGHNIAIAAKTKLCSNDKMIVSGKIKCSEKGYAMFNPDVIEAVTNATDVLGIEPVYRLNSDLTHNKLLKAIDEALRVAEELEMLPESLPENVLEDLGWPTFSDAIKRAHKPANMDEAGVDSPARNRLAFEELCVQQAQLALTRWDLKYSGVICDRDPGTDKHVFTTWRDSPLVSRAVQSLSFELTHSQMNCLDEILDDTTASKNGRMARLLQGDVGSGKTVLAYLAGLGCIESRQGGGSVVALLAPTQLLANQHYETISEFANAFNEQRSYTEINNIRVELLTGSVIGSKREEVMSRIENAQESDAIFLIGTHALVTPDIVERLRNLTTGPPNGSQKNGLALSIVDEEQRFGVRQREAISTCAANALFMSATPIPRTIGLQSSGLLDVTNLESEPRRVQTTISTADNLEAIVGVLKSKIDNGSKAFWVLPRIGEKETDEQGDSKGSVISRHAMLAEMLGDNRVTFVHGRMAIKDREEQLARFADSSSVSVLVSTTVIEVGIDIPNVDILVVENAERFGLSALHQLRGRLGRRGSTNLNYHCILLSEDEGHSAEDGPSTSLQRLDILRETMSGQQIAEADFMLRGPGDLIGVAQSGLFEGRVVNPDAHWCMLSAATVFGRAFVETTKMKESPQSDCLLMKKLLSGELHSYYHHTGASYENGFALRIMMALFADWRSQGEENNTLKAIVTLQKLCESNSNGHTSTDDDAVQQKVESLLQLLSNGQRSLEYSAKASAERKQDKSEALANAELRNDSTKIYLSPSAVTTERVDMTGKDVIFIVLDVETTGLDHKSDYVIQIAAKVLGSRDEADLFSEYILPPIDRIPVIIEQLTGITDSFLRTGGYDATLGAERKGPARSFCEVFVDFRAFCEDRAKGKNVVMIAHNAKFDQGMLNGELRRLRSFEDLPSSISEVFDSSVDSLQLFKDKRMWKSFAKPTKPLQRPDSFKLGYIYQHVFGEPIANSHNAVGDILALDRLLMERNLFFGWERIANDIQRPFSKLLHQ